MNMAAPYSVESEKDFIPVFNYEEEFFTDISKIFAQKTYLVLKNQRPKKKEENPLKFSTEVRFSNIEIPPEKPFGKANVSFLEEEDIFLFLFMLSYLFFCLVVFLLIFFFIWLAEYFNFHFFFLFVSFFVFGGFFNYFLNSKNEVNIGNGILSFLQIILFSIFQCFGLLFFQIYNFGTSIVTNSAKTFGNWLKTQPFTLVLLAVTASFFYLYSQEAMFFWARLIRDYRSIFSQFLSEETLNFIIRQAEIASRKGSGVVFTDPEITGFAKKFSEVFWTIFSVIKGKTELYSIGSKLQEILYNSIEFLYNSIDGILQFLRVFYENVIKSGYENLVKCFFGVISKIWELPFFGPVFLSLLEVLGEFLDPVWRMFYFAVIGLVKVFSPVWIMVKKTTFFVVNFCTGVIKISQIPFLFSTVKKCKREVMKGVMVFVVTKIGYSSGPFGLAIVFIVDFAIMRAKL